MPLLVVALIALTLGGLIMGASSRRPWQIALYSVCGIVGAGGLIILLLSVLFTLGA